MAADGSIIIDVILDDGTVAKGVADIEGKFDGIAGSAKKASIGIGKIMTALGLTALAAKAIDAVRESLDGAINRYDTLNSFPRVMQQMGFDADQSKAAIDKLSDGIQGLPTTLDSVAKTAQRIAIMTGDLEGATDTTLALNNAFLASGASTADAERGLEQYVQMLAKGEVDLEAWRTLQETMGVGLNETAKAFGFTGKAAQNDLYNALKEGDITFDQFNSKIIELSNKTGGFADIARESSGGIKTSWANMKTAIVKGVADVIGAIDEALGGVGSIEGIINKMKTGVQIAFGWIVAAVPIVAGAIQGLVDRVTAEKDRFQVVFSTIQTVVMTVLNAVVPFVKEQLALLTQFWQENGTQILEAVTNAFNMIKSVIDYVMPAVLFVVEIAWTAIQQVISGALNVIMGLVKIFTGLFTGDWSKMWEGVKQLFIGAIDLIIGWMSLTFLGGIRNILINLGKGSVNLVKNMWTSIVNFFKSFGARTTATAQNMVMSVVRFFTNLFSQARSIFTQLRTFGASIWNSLKEAILGAVRQAVSGVTSRFSSMASIVRNLMHNIKSTIQSVWRGIISYLKGINLTSVGKDIIRGLVNGIGSMASAVWNKAKNIADGIGSTIKRALGVASPSRVMIQVGKWTGEGLSIGMDKLVGAVKRSAGHLASAAVPTIQKPSFVNPLRGVRAPLGKIMPFTRVAHEVAVSSTATPTGSTEERYVIEIPFILNGRELAREIVDPVTELQHRQSNRVRRRPR